MIMGPTSQGLSMMKQSNDLDLSEDSQKKGRRGVSSVLDAYL